MQRPPRPPRRRLAASDGDQLRLALAIQHRSPLAAAFAPPQGRLQSLQHTTLANLLDVLHGDPYVTRYLGVAPGRPVCSLVRQQQDLCMAAAIGSHRSFLYQLREFLVLPAPNLYSFFTIGYAIHRNPTVSSCSATDVNGHDGRTGRTADQKLRRYALRARPGCVVGAHPQRQVATRWAAGRRNPHRHQQAPVAALKLYPVRVREPAGRAGRHPPGRTVTVTRPWRRRQRRGGAALHPRQGELGTAAVPAAARLPACAWSSARPARRA